MAEAFGTRDAMVALAKAVEGWSHQTLPWKPDHVMLQKKKCSLREKGQWAWRSTGEKMGRYILVKFKLWGLYILHYILFHLPTEPPK